MDAIQTNNNNKKKPYFTTYKIVFLALMAAIVFVVTYFRFPLLGSKVHFANAMCLLSGLLFGPVGGGLAAGIGSGLFDLLNGYGIDEAIVTTVSKFLMAFICAVIAGTLRGEDRKARIVLGGVIGALSYVVLYMLKTYVYRRFIYAYTLDATWATMLSKLPASLINAVFAMIVAPIFYAALKRVLQRSAVLEKLR